MSAGWQWKRKTRRPPWRCETPGTRTLPVDCRSKPHRHDQSMCLGSAGNGEAKYPVSVDSAPSGRGFSRHDGLLSDVSCGVQTAREQEVSVVILKPWDFLLLRVAARFHWKIWLQDRL